MSRSGWRCGVSAVYVLFVIASLAALGLAAAAITGGGAVSSPDFHSAAESLYAARSGIEWVKLKTAGYTTADKNKWLGLDGTRVEYAGPGGPAFVIAVRYSDPDEDPMTDDIVTVASTGFSSGAERTLEMTAPVPSPSTAIELFSDDFRAEDAPFFEDIYVFGLADGPHSAMDPYLAVTGGPGGDTEEVFTHASEPGGRRGVLVMGGKEEARLTIHTGSCFKWSRDPAVPCGGAECSASGPCQARRGIGAPVDDEGYQNYFIRIRARLLSGKGFGLYFRASYPRDESGRVDFGGLTSYAWQYDAGMGYLAPCDMMTAVAGSDGEGMFFTRRIEKGSETCGPGCSLFTARNPSPPENSWPFFCPENRTGLDFLNGWRWRSGGWTAGWRTVYIYVYKDRASVYLGREEISGRGSEHYPEPVGIIYLGSMEGLLRSGAIGVRAIEDSVVEIDYIRIYSNEADLDPGSFPGAG
ncbi:MAG: hypothetical protein ACNS63_12030 [Candidatus Nitrospinota bacterium M3_3B_026]